MQITLEELQKGVICPYCGQDCVLRRETIDSTKAYCMISLWNVARHGGWTHVSDIPLWWENGKQKTANNYGGSFAALRYWGLIEEQYNLDTKKRCAGMWRITPLGCDFVLNKVRVPKYWRIFDMVQFYAEGDHIGIKSALGEKFDYSEIKEEFYSSNDEYYDDRQQPLF
tara:strand:+ start:3266 stop:3772 length:507 start_codon:yes stop_codon:yes gene_type:complete